MPTYHSTVIFSAKSILPAGAISIPEPQHLIDPRLTQGRYLAHQQEHRVRMGGQRQCTSSIMTAQRNMQIPLRVIIPQWFATTLLYQVQWTIRIGLLANHGGPTDTPTHHYRTLSWSQDHEPTLPTTIQHHLLTHHLHTLSTHVNQHTNTTTSGPANSAKGLTDPSWLSAPKLGASHRALTPASLTPHDTPPTLSHISTHLPQPAHHHKHRHHPNADQEDDHP